MSDRKMNWLILPSMWLFVLECMTGARRPRSEDRNVGLFRVVKNPFQADLEAMPPWGRAIAAGGVAVMVAGICVLLWYVLWVRRW